MANANRKQVHSYRVSYAQEVGSSFDPDMEDVGSWEHELKEPSMCLSPSMFPCPDFSEFRFADGWTIDIELPKYDSVRA